MNLKMVLKYLGYLIMSLAVFFLPSVGVAFFYAETHATLSLLAAAGTSAALGLALWLPCRRESAPIYAREGFVVAGLGWLLVSVLGALPFFFSGEIPNFVDALFESVSGFTTTGASILTDVEAMSRGLVFWRSFTHWLGGIGVLAFILAVVRAKSGAGFTMHLLRAETPGPQVGKLVPKTRESVRSLFLVYGVLSAVNLIFLLAGGMPLFDAFCTMFGTAGTGGFGIKNASMADYSPYLQTVTTVFMALFGVNFTLYFLLARRDWRAVLRDEELRLYVGIVVVAIALITLDLSLSGVFNSVGEGLHHGAFTVSSVITTTGYATTNFDLWPQFSRSLLLLLMFSGAMAGSTAGGLKTARVLILWKSIRSAVYRLVHPRSVRTVKINGKPLEEGVIARTQFYFCVYIGILLMIFLLISVDNLPLEANFSAAVSCFNNVGPGLGMVGPAANYSVYSLFSKGVLTLGMLLGRLEIFPIVVLLLPGTWSRKN